ncbi:hypothetical protein QVD17_31074 [Tagetes erecta]|uniref:Phytocyanin domain-containing protein n=1 Tax=Tagetes erecta TaxID=13708 RepID=A0AAD8K5H6_TARER|nr:hypothetical protein QVD17_31074 [Tagetes erecta]
MANKNLCIFILATTIVAQATWIQATDHLVGDEPLGWNGNKDYQAWADGKEFLQMDTLGLFYTYRQHNVVVVKDKEAYDKCSTNGAIWVSPHYGESKRNYQVFGDIMSYDATYRSNRYLMVFVPFTGIDNHNNNVSFGAALLASDVGMMLCNTTDFKQLICDIVWIDSLVLMNLRKVDILLLKILI